MPLRNREQRGKVISQDGLPLPALGMEIANQVKKPEKRQGAGDAALQGVTPGDLGGEATSAPTPGEVCLASLPSSPQQETPGTGKCGQEWVSSHRQTSDHAVTA